MPQDQTSQQEDNIQDLNFEEAYSKLGEIVESLENGGLTLAESTQIYERGMGLATYCNHLLDKAKLRITEITQNNSHSSLLEDE